MNKKYTFEFENADGQQEHREYIADSRAYATETMFTVCRRLRVMTNDPTWACTIVKVEKTEKK